MDNNLRKVNKSIACGECIACWIRATAGTFFIVASILAVSIFIASQTCFIVAACVFQCCGILIAGGVGMLALLWIVDTNIRSYRRQAIEVTQIIVMEKRIESSKQRRNEHRDRYLADHESNGKALWGQATLAAAA